MQTQKTSQRRVVNPSTLVSFKARQLPQENNFSYSVSKGVYWLTLDRHHLSKKDGKVTVLLTLENRKLS